MASVFWTTTLDQFWLLLKAPFHAPEMWWIIFPLILTFLVMTFYFGLYKKEELGWNSALGNTVVLFFVALDLIRTLYNYTVPPSILNFIMNPWKLLVIVIIVAEAILLFKGAFKHSIPKKVMFFIASPLPVNLQAYVIVAIVYLRLPPTWYMLSAAVLLFVVLFIVSKILQVVQYIYVERRHKRRVRQIQDLRKEARSLRRKANNSRGRKKKRLNADADDKVRIAKDLELKLRNLEHLQHGKLRAAKVLLEE